MRTQYEDLMFQYDDLMRSQYEDLMRSQYGDLMSSQNEDLMRFPAKPKQTLRMSSISQIRRN